MSLPRLLMPPLGASISCGNPPCANCALRKVCSKNCTSTRECSQRTCKRDCDKCGGSRPAEREAGLSTVPAVCSKAPLKDLLLEDVKREQYAFTKRKAIRFKSKAIIVTNGSCGLKSDWYPPETEVVAINYTHVWSATGRGWYSRDLKDYLKIPSGVKLLLMTSSLDDALERAWDHYFQNEDYKSVGFDYWQALEFSLYDNRSHFNNLWTSYRNLYTQAVSKSHFSHLPPIPLQLTSRHLKPWLDSVRAAPNIMTNMQMDSITTPRGQDAFRRMIWLLRRWLDLNKEVKPTIWIAGAVSPALIYNIQRNLQGEDIYYSSLGPWVTANKGQEVTLKGTVTRSSVPRAELILQNQTRYATLVNQAVNAANAAT